MNKFNLFQSYRQKAEQKEEQTLHAKASFSKQHQRNQGTEDDHRLPYKRDVDRILHSKAYARYIDKTQVVYLVENDHITHRSLHVQLVSNFARGIAEILCLNLDLVEAIALGHDVGHPPFGHEGEVYLSALAKEYDHHFFAHPFQSCRLFTEIEPLNLGLTVYDGFLCHDGGIKGTKLEPRYGKTWEDHTKDKQAKLQDPDRNLLPSTLEGCLVKICDTVSYLGKDIEDAIHLGIILRQQVPQTLLGQSNRQILTTIAQDIITQSYEQDFIAISEEVYEALLILRKFNFENIYINPKLKVESTKIRNSYRYLFEALLEEQQESLEQSYIWKNFLCSKRQAYLEHTSPVERVIDFMAGMTDSFFVRTLEKILVPKRIELLS